MCPVPARGGRSMGFKAFKNSLKFKLWSWWGLLKSEGYMPWANAALCACVALVFMTQPYSLSGDQITIYNFIPVALYVFLLKRQKLHFQAVYLQGWTRVSELENEKISQWNKMSEEIRQTENRAKKAEERARLAEAATRTPPYRKENITGGDDKFSQVKRAFARLYHPDHVQKDGTRSHMG